jgi:hypothetical protein
MKAPHSSTSSSEPSGRRGLLACVWAAVVLVVFDLICARVLPEGFLLESEDQTRARAETQQAPDIQVVGDSVVRSGLMPHALGDDTIVVRNDGMAASGPPKTYLLLERQFATGRIPRTLVIAHSPHTFGRVRYEELIGAFAYWSEIPGLIAEADEAWTDALYGLLTRFSYVLRHRDSFRDLLTNAKVAFFKDRSPQIFVDDDSKRLSEFHSMAKDGTFSRDRLTQRLPDFYRNTFAVTPTNDRYFRKILRLAQEHGVRVYWISLPTPGEVAQARKQSDYQRLFLDYLRQFEREGLMTILLAEAPIYPDTMFSDWLHLNLAGAVRFACELEEIKEPLMVSAVPVKAVVASAASQSDTFKVQLSPLCPLGSAEQLRAGS